MFYYNQTEIENSEFNIFEHGHTSDVEMFGEGVLTSFGDFLKRSVVNLVKTQGKQLVKTGVEAAGKKAGEKAVQKVTQLLTPAQPKITETVKNQSRNNVAVLRQAMRGKQTSLSRDISKLRKRYVGMGLTPIISGSP